MIGLRGKGLQCGRRTLSERRCNPINGMARPTSRQGRPKRSERERYSPDVMLLLRFLPAGQRPRPS